VQAVFKEIEAIQREGTTQSYVDQVKESQRRERETNLKTNEFWLSALEVYDTEGLDLRDLMRFDELLDQVTSKRLQTAAKRYLGKQHYVLGVLDPAPKDTVGKR